MLREKRVVVCSQSKGGKGRGNGKTRGERETERGVYKYGEKERWGAREGK